MVTTKDEMWGITLNVFDPVLESGQLAPDLILNMLSQCNEDLDMLSSQKFKSCWYSGHTAAAVAR